MDEKMKTLEVRQGQFDDRLSQLEKGKENTSAAIKKLDVDKILTSAEGSKTAAAPVLAKVPSQGFTASVPASGKPVPLFKRQRLTCLTTVTFNPGGHYDPATWTYTVPVTGWYRVKLSHSHSYWAEEEKIRLQVMLLQRQARQSADGQSPEVVEMCETQTVGRNCWDRCKLQATDEKVVDLCVGDKLFVQVYGSWKNPAKVVCTVNVILGHCCPLQAFHVSCWSV